MLNLCDPCELCKTTIQFYNEGLKRIKAFTITSVHLVFILIIITDT